MFITTGMLSKDVKKAQATLGAYLRATFPDLGSFQTRYKQEAGPLLVEGNRSTAGLIGTSLDLIVQLSLRPEVVPSTAIMMLPAHTDFHGVVGELAHMVSDMDNLELQARAVYAMAECVAAFRAGPVWGYLMFERIRRGLFTVDEALLDASDDSVAELIALRRIISEQLLPHVRDPLHLAPTFDLTHLGPERRLAAEADLITDGLLIDIKSNMGLKNKRGARPDTLRPEHLYQVIAYALLDFSDAYRINHIGIFSARYGQLHRWPLHEILDGASGTAIDLNAAREDVWDMMQAEPEYIER